MQYFLILFVIFSNYWIIKIFDKNLQIFVLLIFITFVLFLLLYSKWKFKKIVTAMMMFVLLLGQFLTTEIQDLKALDNDEQRVQQIRLRAYDPSVLRIGYLLEGKEESIIFYRIKKNFFENLDLNLYFFGNYPRQRVGIEEMEKFPFILLPFFVVGLVFLLKKKISWILLIPIIVIPFLGNKNILGPFSLFPIFVLSIYEGVSLGRKQLKNKYKIWFLLIFVSLTILILIQQILYESF